MTQITPEQQQMLEAAAKSVAAKLQSFRDGLSNDEQRVLGFAFDAIAAARSEEDVAGYVDDPVLVVREWCLTWRWRPGQPLPGPLQPDATPLGLPTPF